MFKFSIVAVAAVFIAAAGAAAAAPVMTDAGQLEGVREGQLTVYKGAPFAAPPVGELRWRPPAPVQPWSGVRKADAFAPACMQTGVSMPGETPPKVSEDCLYLNIWTPAAARGARLPGMVFFPGGGFTNGSAAMPLYWGDRLARRGVVFVTVGYRLGPFGFLAHPELSRESPQHVSGDYALMDQIAALRWVRANITAFGGDPGRVTIMGQSAGSMSVSMLMASPQAAGLFQRAIGESGGMFEPLQLAPDYLLPAAEREGEAYAVAHGAASIEALRRVPAAQLLEGKTGAVSHPVMGTEVLPAAPYDTFAAGRQNDVPILIGSNAEEARALVDLKPVTAARYISDLEQQFGPAVAAMAGRYPHATDEEARQARAHFERDLRFGWDVWAWARLAAASGRSKVFYYHFTQSPPFPAQSVYAGWGPSHFAELWYVFDHLDQQPWRWTAGDRRLAEVMASYWINFARIGDPNGPGLPLWPAYENARPQAQYLGDPIKPGGVADLDTLGVIDAAYASVRSSR